MRVVDPLVSVDWLKEYLNAPDVRVLDATWIAPWVDANAHETARKLYNEGHIPGAVYFDIDEIADQDTDLPHMMPPPEKFSSRARKMGMGDGNRIVIYDRGNFMASARVWWMFRAMGHSDIRVLDGGWNAWVKADGPVEDLPPLQKDRHFTVRVQNHLIKDYGQVCALKDNPNVVVIDARPEGRFKGQDNEPREGLPSGHIPGSINIPMSTLVTPEGYLKSADELRVIFKAIEEDDYIVASCGSGVSAAVILLALQRLGRDDVALYDGSWTDYASRAYSEIATS